MNIGSSMIQTTDTLQPSIGSKLIQAAVFVGARAWAHMLAVVAK
jgi:hypothetical protein